MSRNRQDMIKEYKDYGYSNTKIAEVLDIDIIMVNSALMEYNRPITERETQSLKRLYKGSDWKSHARDKHMGSYEVLYKYGAQHLNKIIKRYGLRPAADWLHIRQNDLISLKIHFGYYNNIPGDAIERITYFSHDIRKEVDERDKRACIRCRKALDAESIRYHKITHPGAMTMANCATLCDYCREGRVIKHIKAHNRVFYGMTFENFRTWIHDNDPAAGKEGKTW